MTKPIERVGVIGDIHAEHVSLMRAIRVLEDRGVELLLATGDVVDGAGAVDECCELLASHGVITVAGNHDRWLLAGTARDLPDATEPSSVSERSHAFLRSLPRMVELKTVSGLALLCHGLGPDDMAQVRPEDTGYALECNDELQSLIRDGSFRWVLNGHSHRRMVRAFPGITIINAGTLLRGHSPCFLEVDFRQAKVLVFELGTHASLAQPPIVVTLE